MQTPQQRAEWETWLRRQPAENIDLERMVDRAVEKSGLTSRGGTFEFPLQDLEDVPLVQDYCARYGWICTYEPYQVPASFGDYSLTVHIFRLEPR